MQTACHKFAAGQAYAHAAARRDPRTSVAKIVMTIMEAAALLSIGIKVSKFDMPERQLIMSLSSTKQQPTT